MTTPYPPPFDDKAPTMPAPAPNQMLVPEELIPPVRGFTAFLSSQVRAGDWILPRLFRAVSFLGNAKIDLTGARLGAGVSRIELMVILGSVTILVPPDVRIQCDGDAIIGSFDVRGQQWSTSAPGAPTVHVTGTSFLGSVEVIVVNPNAPSWVKQLKTRWAELRSGE